MVEVAIEAEQRVTRERAQARLTSNAPPANSMRVVQQLVQRLRRDRTRVVGFPLRLLDDHLELARQLVRIDERVRICIGLHLEPLTEPRGGKDRVVAGM